MRCLGIKIEAHCANEGKAAPIPLLRLLVEHLLAQGAVAAVLGHRLAVGAVHVVAIILPLRTTPSMSKSCETRKSAGQDRAKYSEQVWHVRDFRFDLHKSVHSHKRSQGACLVLVGQLVAAAAAGWLSAHAGGVLLPCSTMARQDQLWRNVLA